MNFYADIFSIILTVTTLKKFFSHHFSFLGAMLGYFEKHFENFLIKFCSDVLSTTIIVTAFFFTLFLPLLRVILGYSWARFCAFFSFFENHLIFFHEILYISSWYYSDSHFTKNNFSCYVLFCWGLSWGYFRGYFGV